MAGNRRFQEYHINGSDEAVRALTELPVRMRAKYLRIAMRKGANVVRKASSDSWRKLDDWLTPNKIWQEVAVRANSRLGDQNGGIAFSVGVKGGARRPYKRNKDNIRTGRAGKKYEVGTSVYYWRFLELGTKFIDPPRRIFERTLAQKSPEAIQTIVASLNKSLDEFAREQK